MLTRAAGGVDCGRCAKGPRLRPSPRRAGLTPLASFLVPLLSGTRTAETEQNRGRVGQAANVPVAADSVGVTKAGYQRWKTAASSSFRTLARTCSSR
jgi:hypothetical protein